jgi:hypothetical protein
MKQGSIVKNALAIALAFVSLAGCAKIPLIGSHFGKPSPKVAVDTLELMKTRTREAVPSSPRNVAPVSKPALAIYREGLRKAGLRIMVSTDDKALWLMSDTTVLMRAPVAIGKQQDFTFRGKHWDFDTPIGKRKVLGKGLNPLWSPPEWHYYELASEQNLDPVFLQPGKPVKLADNTTIEIRGDQVGRVNSYGNFWPFEPGSEMIFDGKIFIPPQNTLQRHVPKVLGGHKLEMGNGYLIHGTDQESSIGGAVSHGCVRMYNDDVAQLYALVPVGTPIFIF